MSGRRTGGASSPIDNGPAICDALHNQDLSVRSHANKKSAFTTSFDAMKNLLTAALLIAGIAAGAAAIMVATSTPAIAGCHGSKCY